MTTREYAEKVAASLQPVTQAQIDAAARILAASQQVAA